ncbi:MAG: class II D-tagatose-bisphosphate aldolase, non-catalytic subunit [Gammaproteobacteria bacterium]|nr:class II D-tagatose-bisphosphate aldolase, non-catalytic subunit [Gammaproteobacteria bacterium]
MARQARQRTKTVFPASLREREPASARQAVRGLPETLAANRAGQSIGLYAVCSAHPVALEAALTQAVRDGTGVLIEATANQVNQFGGYTGMRAADFHAEVHRLACAKGLGPERVVLGGDHLGPVCWARERACTAMAKAHELVASYVAAGFTKIHLDTSMACADDPRRLPEATVVRRAAELCRTAERIAVERFGSAGLHYVIGTEVPEPGGARDAGKCEPTTPCAARRTVEAHELAFRALGLDAAWERVVAVVVQPGVEFDNASVTDYVPERAQGLKALIASLPNLVYEAHSTDYQRADSLAALVRDHFAIVKVGPQLTYAVREALFALSQIETELVRPGERTDLPAVCERAIVAAPGHCRGYGGSGPGLVAQAFGQADRVRYYWTHPAVAAAVETLHKNLATVEIPAPLVEQHLPHQYEAVRAGAVKPRPQTLVLDHVMRVTAHYARACNASDSSARTDGVEP